MPTTPLVRRLLTTVAMTGIVLVGACDDDDDPSGPAAGLEVSALVLSTAETADLTVADDGTVSGGPFDFDTGGHPVSVTVLDPDGQPIDEDDLDGYEVRVVSESAGILSVSTNGPFAFTISGLAGGMGSFTVALFQTDEAENVLGPTSVPVQIIGGGGA